jgi:UDP-glucose 4-epimerase
MDGSEYSRALVTGGAGFIGSHIVDRLLNEGFEVEVFDNLDTGKLENVAHNQHEKEFHFSKGDILDFYLIRKSFKDIDVVFHEAAIASVTLSVENRSPIS